MKKKTKTEPTKVIWDNYLSVNHSGLLDRLAGITQIITFPKNANTRTRLSHTLDVIWLAFSIAPKLALNTKLCLAIALAHDIGHMPFGHDGEKVCRKLLGSMCFNHGKMGTRLLKILGYEMHPWVEYGIINHSDGDEHLNKHKVLAPEETWKINFFLVAALDDIACAISDLIDSIYELKNIHDAEIQQTYAEACNLLDRILVNIGEKDFQGNLEAAHQAILEAFSRDIVYITRVKRKEGLNGIFLSNKMRGCFDELKEFAYNRVHKTVYITTLRDECANWLKEVMLESRKIMMEEDYSSSQLGIDIKIFFIKVNYGEEKPSIEEQVVDFICTCTDMQIKTYYQQLNQAAT